MRVRSLRKGRLCDTRLGRIRCAMREAGFRPEWRFLRKHYPPLYVQVARGHGRTRSPADVWFSDWRRGGAVLEEARYLKSWDQTLTLLWFEDEEVPPLLHQEREVEDEDPLLPELDGVLPWPGKRRRR